MVSRTVISVNSNWQQGPKYGINISHDDNIFAETCRIFTDSKGLKYLFDQKGLKIKTTMMNGAYQGLQLYDQSLSWSCYCGS
ncbi:hypothetical protein DVH24_015440 [Malus domestica]|uniref:Uncharacterized protein n=1 Tax=Malus domestica TaxID=3750 RepID=A0A498HH49_MALDO|nr:hypothetical protein DVH24_015440 [Malus domestica]